MRSQPCVLLVEDNPDEADLIAHAFRKAQAPHRLAVVNDGEQAIEYLEGGPPFQDRAQHPLPAVVLLDLKLPRQSGFAVLEWVRARPHLPHVQLVVLTSSRQEEDVRRAYKLCANSYLVKPVRRDALVGVVQMVNRYWTDLNRVPA